MNLCHDIDRERGRDPLAAVVAVLDLTPMFGPLEPGLGEIEDLPAFIILGSNGGQKSLRREGETNRLLDPIFYLAGIFFNTSSRNPQNRSTVAMLTFSSGEWGNLMVGPKEIMSILG